MKHNGGKTWSSIKTTLEKLGYEVDVAKLSPHNFGIPQIRDRVYIVGSLGPLRKFVWPNKLDMETSIQSVLDVNPPNAKRLSAQVQSCLNVWNEFLSKCPKGVELPSFPLWSMEWGATYPFESTTPWALKKKSGIDGLKGFKGSHGEKIEYIKTIEGRWAALPSHARTEQAEFPKWKKDFIRNNRQFYEDNASWINPWLEKVLSFPSSLQKFEWNVKGGERDIWKYVIQFRASGVRIKRPTAAPSLIAMTDTQVPIIGWEKRYMTVTECARLQSLDDFIELPKNPTRAFHALGNAVNSHVVELVARALLNTDENTVSPRHGKTLEKA
jgi:DNA (cytosine-5)-methyltransferase 1